MTNDAAWTRAAWIAQRLPIGITWSYHVTSVLGDSVFNIWADRETWPSLSSKLQLGMHDETNTDSITWYEESLTLSLIHPEEHNG